MDTRFILFLVSVGGLVIAGTILGVGEAVTGWVRKYAPGLGGIFKFIGYVVVVIAVVVGALWWEFASPLKPDWSWREAVFVGLVIAVLVLWQRMVLVEKRLDRLDKEGK